MKIDLSRQAKDRRDGAALNLVPALTEFVQKARELRDSLRLKLPVVGLGLLGFPIQVAIVSPPGEMLKGLGMRGIFKKAFR